jgi:hypothetical protein
MAEARIARKHFLKGLGVAAAACVAAPVRVVAAKVGAPTKSQAVKTADLPFKVRPAAKIVARPDIRA